MKTMEGMLKNAKRRSKQGERWAMRNGVSPSKRCGSSALSDRTFRAETDDEWCDHERPAEQGAEHTA